ncbi:hypothetical protein SAMN02745181_1266 [Rubritalea squalenifaciens DSM 18772]|uniref:Uncharacterized protein n=1 Tax=Rubritalea squalenifaciens DSM 18772 TaxID=1123071 RepID=A0A1M6GTZ4_9BACT|nr:hypothetical protein [Rubritalea squalenifaciens]SHJ13397.1 hypothetical protein SAMN02745181_1266 [Rubritalea squalenifaciens DSM 18772]
MPLIKFSLDEVEFSKATTSLKRAIRGRGVRAIQCHLTKTRLRIDCGEWGKASIPVVSPSTSRFTITPSALGKAASAYRDFKRGSTTDAFAVLDKKLGFLRTYRMDIKIK